MGGRKKERIRKKEKYSKMDQIGRSYFGPADMTGQSVGVQNSVMVP